MHYLHLLMIHGAVAEEHQSWEGDVSAVAGGGEKINFSRVPRPSLMLWLHTTKTGIRKGLEDEGILNRSNDTIVHGVGILY